MNIYNGIYNCKHFHVDQSGGPHNLHTIPPPEKL